MSSDNPAPTPSEGSDAGRLKSFPALLDRLFKVTADDRGREVSYSKVAAAIEAAGGPTVSSTYLHELRTGKKDNPTRRTLDALATYFGVPPAYFFDEAFAAEVDAHLETLRDAGVMDLATRARGLSPESLEALSRMAEEIRHSEGLDHSKRDNTQQPPDTER